MRLTSKPNTGKPGISTALAMRSNVALGPASTIEALVMAYEPEHLIKVIYLQRRFYEKEGCCNHNRQLNAMLNATAIPMSYIKPMPKKNARKRRAA